MGFEELVRPREDERDALEYIAKLLQGRELEFFSRVDDRPLALPETLAEVLDRVLAEMARGNAVSVVPMQAELTPRQAAELLGVSRPYVSRLMKEGLIPSRNVGTHHRIRLTDLLAYRKKRDDARHGALDELARESERLDIK